MCVCVVVWVYVVLPPDEDNKPSSIEQARRRWLHPCVYVFVCVYMCVLVSGYLMRDRRGRGMSEPRVSDGYLMAWRGGSVGMCVCVCVEGRLKFETDTLFRRPAGESAICRRGTLPKDFTSLLCEAFTVSQIIHNRSGALPFACLCMSLLVCVCVCI